MNTPSARNRLVLATLTALALVSSACSKSPPQPSPAEPGIAPSPTTAGNVVAGPGVPGAVPRAETATKVPEYVHPLQPTAKELETIRAETEAYYQSPQGASGPGHTPSPPR
jgi:hypothetical protein